MSLLTTDQLSQIEYNKELENIRKENEITQKLFNARLEAVRLAKEALNENKRNLPVSEREISADDIIEYADKLVNYIKN